MRPRVVGKGRRAEPMSNEQIDRRCWSACMFYWTLGINR